MVQETITSLIRAIIPSTLKGYFYRIGCSLAKDLEVGHQPSMEWSIRNLRKLGFNPHSIVDVGAYHGKWTKMVKTIYPSSHVLMIEAQKGKEKYLKRVKDHFGGSVDYSITLLASMNNLKVIFCEMESGSSFFEERSSVSRNYIEYETKTLEFIASEFNITNISFLKIDAQGSELEVLKGSANILHNIEVILMEVSLIQINKGAPLLHEVVDFMKQRNFIAYDICSLMRRPLDNALWQIDMIFIRQDSKLLGEPRAGF